MKRFFKSLFHFQNRLARKRPAAKPKPVALQVEDLENRQLLSVTLAGGNLVINAATNGSTVAVNNSVRVVQSPFGGTLYLPQIRVNENGADSFFDPSAVYGNTVIFNGSNARDFFQNNTGLRSQAFGNGEVDVLYGGSAGDTLNGGAGNDLLFGRGGNDRIGAHVQPNGVWLDDVGNDEMYGGSGRDTIGGGFDNDKVFGEGEEDELWGDYGDDTVNGGGGNDKLFGWYGRDTLGAYVRSDGAWVDDPGNDTLWGWEGNDTLAGGTGNDSLLGEGEDDYLWGDDGTDVLRGGDGQDHLFGQSQADDLWGDGGNDSLHGGDGNDILHGGSGNDQLGAYWDNNFWVDDEGSDLMFGDENNDVLGGGTGNDSLYGGQHDDNLWGDAGNDGLFGGVTGRDSLHGGGGADRFLEVRAAYGVDEDPIYDSAAEDATVYFMNYFGSFTTKSWNDSDVIAIDKGLAWLHAVTNNTTLLKLKGGGDWSQLLFWRTASLGSTPSVVTLADNDSRGNIRFADAAFDPEDAPTDQTAVHEIGHNWDDENAKWQDFKDLSGWKPLALTATVPSGYIRGVDLSGVQQPWIYRATAQFSRLDGYGRTDPYEDFATCLETYYSGSNPAGNWQQKWNFIDDFLRGLRT